MMQNEIEKIITEYADKAQAVILSYIDDDGFPVTKAMLAPRERDGFGTFYMTTNTSSNKVRCFRNNPKASIYFVEAQSYKGLTLTGKVEVMEDRASKERVWRDGDTIYYHEGVTDPDYCVLKFTAEKGSYYSNINPQKFTIEQRK